VVLVSGLTPVLVPVLVLGAGFAAALDLVLEELLLPQAPSSSPLTRTREIARARVFIQAKRYPYADPAALISFSV
jgi:hypothetical protein